MESRFHAPEEFLDKFGSKLDLYKLLTVDCKQPLTPIILVGFYLPSFGKNDIALYETTFSKTEKGYIWLETNQSLGAQN